MKIFSEACEYALRASVWLGQRPQQTYKVREIADGTHAAPGYLVKVLQRLAKAGILSAQRGSQGGFTLEKSPDAVTVLDVINAVDPIERIEICPLGFESHAENLCPLHRRLDDAIAGIEEGFRRVTIADLIVEPSSSPALCDRLQVDIRLPKPERDQADRPRDIPA